MADVPKEDNDIVFNNTIRENFRNFSELGFKNTINNSRKTDSKDSVQDLYKDGFNELELEIVTGHAVNKLNNSNDDLVGYLTNVNSTFNVEIQHDTNLNLSIWNICRVSF